MSEQQCYCEVCGVEVEYMADWCDKHAMTNAQLGELARRVQQAMRDYRARCLSPQGGKVKRFRRRPREVYRSVACCHPHQERL